MRAEDLLAPFVPPPRSERGNYTLERMHQLMKELGSPQEKYPVIHIAGTSGKTSTSYYIAELLKQNGLRVGLTVSPHVESIGERVQINGVPLHNDEFIEEFNYFKQYISTEIEPTYFEVLIAFAYWYFAKKQVDVAVIETGLGGLLDGTNVVEAKNKTCVITDIGLDHTQVLGDTIPEIAAQKAGIIHSGNTVYMLEQPNEVLEVFRARVHSVGAELHLLKEAIESSDLPLFQNRNFSLARQVCEHWLGGRGEELHHDSRVAAMHLQVPARMEVFKINDKTVVLDGAHNPQKLNQFVRSFKVKYPNAKPLLLTAILASGEVRTKSNVEQLALLEPSHTIVTEFVSLQDIKKRSVSAEHLCDELRLARIEAEIVKDSKSALEKALNSTQNIIVITGSLYLLFDLRPLLVHSKD